MARLPDGRRRKALAERLKTKVVPAFGLPATAVYAELLPKAQAEGKAIGQAFGLIAAIAKTHARTVAARDTAPFAAGEGGDRRSPGARAEGMTHCALPIAAPKVADAYNE